MQKFWKNVWYSENAKVMKKCVLFIKCKSCKIKLVWFSENAKVRKNWKCKSYEKVCVIQKMQKLEN